MTNLKDIFTQDLTALSLEQQRQILSDAEKTSEATYGQWHEKLANIDMSDVPQIVNLSSNHNKAAGGFKHEVDTISEARDLHTTLEHVQAKLLLSSYPEIQDRAAKDIDAQIKDIVEATQSERSNFNLQDLERVLHYASKHYKVEDSASANQQSKQKAETESISGLVDTLVLYDLAEGENDIRLSLTGKRPLEGLTDEGENMLIRLQQLSTRDLVKKLDQSPKP